MKKFIPVAEPNIGTKEVQYVNDAVKSGWVSSLGYFVFARVNKGDGFGMGQAALPFHIFVESYQGDDSWVEGILKNIKETLNENKPPMPSDDCQYCLYNKTRNNI